MYKTQISPWTLIFLQDKSVGTEDIKSSLCVWEWMCVYVCVCLCVSVSIVTCCLFTNQAWNIPQCWPARFLCLRHWGWRQDADWLLSAGEQWWKYLQDMCSWEKRRTYTHKYTSTKGQNLSITWILSGCELGQPHFVLFQVETWESIKKLMTW